MGGNWKSTSIKNHRTLVKSGKKDIRIQCIEIAIWSAIKIKIRIINAVLESNERETSSFLVEFTTVGEENFSRKLKVKSSNFACQRERCSLTCQL